MPNTKNLVHGSFLSGKPAEAAGVIGINDRGKIGALDKNCQIDIQGHLQILVTDFVKNMETKVGFRKNAKTHYEKLR
ncbi:hypothetical protein Rh054_04335 [Rickettsia conorii subsp. heilongjiangensis 054]|nr:hypothetical protein Rh054_04335 [Rickettsia conorii subsp. heilongjiangensis 054]